MEQIFIDVLAQELIKAKEIAEKAEVVGTRKSWPCNVEIRLHIPFATKEEYESIAKGAGLGYYLPTDHYGVVLVLGSEYSNDLRPVVIAAFTHLVTECDAYEWILEYRPL